MRIDIWSDVVCPWCYLGKRRLEQAIAALDPAVRDDVEVVYHSFQLDPTAPTEATEKARDMLQRRYGLSAEQAAEAQGRVIALAAEEGMHWRHEDSPYVGSGDAHRLLHLALAEGRQAELKEALLHAYFGEARNVADHVVLREVAVSAGLPAARVDEVLASDEYADAVAADVQQAAAYGATGVPFFVFDQRYAVSGAQPTEVFAQVLERVLAEVSAGQPTPRP